MGLKRKTTTMMMMMMFGRMFTMKTTDTAILGNTITWVREPFSMMERNSIVTALQGFVLASSFATMILGRFWTSSLPCWEPPWREGKQRERKEVTTFTKISLKSDGDDNSTLVVVGDVQCGIVDSRTLCFAFFLQSFASSE